MRPTQILQDVDESGGRGANKGDGVDKRDIEQYEEGEGVDIESKEGNGRGVGEREIDEEVGAMVVVSNENEQKGRICLN